MVGSDLFAFLLKTCCDLVRVPLMRFQSSFFKFSCALMLIASAVSPTSLSEQLMIKMFAIVG